MSDSKLSFPGDLGGGDADEDLVFDDFDVAEPATAAPAGAAVPAAEALGDGDGDGEEELVFDDFDMAAPAEPTPAQAAMPAPAAPVDEPQPRRAPRRGRKAVEKAAPGALGEQALASSASADAGLRAAAAEEPAGGKPASFPPRETQPAGSDPHRLLLAIVALALFTSLLSLGGLIAVSRTLAHAGVAREEAVAERDALRRVPALVAHLDDASARLDTATANLAAASPHGPPASAADVQRQIDALRLALDQRQPAGIDSLNDQTRSGFSEIATRLDRIQARLAGAPGRPARQDEDEGLAGRRAPNH